MKEVKVYLVGAESSAGRGVGFYADFLRQSLQATDEVIFTRVNPDLVHYPFFDLFYPTLPFLRSKPTVVTIHDLTPLILSGLYPKGIRGSLNLIRQRLVLSTVKGVITDSENSKSDIVKLFNFNHKKVHVIPLASDPLYSKEVSAKKISEVKNKYHLPDHFILYVGGINANKNLVRLAKACLDLNFPLVLVGSEFVKEIKDTDHAELKEFNQLRALIQGRELIHTPGFVPSEDLAAIYRLAAIYCQPSLYEGFGIPLLEAMSAGCLTVSSNTSSLPEIYPKGSLVFDPYDENEIKLVISKALELKKTDKEKIIKTAQKRAQDFSWAKTAKETLKVYRSVI